MDSELFDRQNRVWGIETTKKITQSSVCIYGLEGGLGTEIAKNLALCGIYKIFLCDNNVITRNDLDAGYYYTYADIGKNIDYLVSKTMKGWINSKELKDNPNSRRAVISILEKTDLLLLDKDETLEFPCADSATFYIREGKLNAHLHMRSQNMGQVAKLDMYLWGRFTNELAKEFHYL